MIGEKRRFTFDTRMFEVIEEIGNTNISMDWHWGTQICPHCKQKIEKIMTHTFKVIEILVPLQLLDADADKKTLLDNIIMMGLDIDGRKLLLNKETQEKAIKHSIFFKEVI